MTLLLLLVGHRASPAARDSELRETIGASRATGATKNARGGRVVARPEPMNTAANGEPRPTSRQAGERFKRSSRATDRAPKGSTGLPKNRLGSRRADETVKKLRPLRRIPQRWGKITDVRSALTPACGGLPT
jgi:hypothetical protein